MRENIKESIPQNQTEDALGNSKDQTKGKE